MRGGRGTEYITVHLFKYVMTVISKYIETD